jgi:hypothetical protein
MVIGCRLPGPDDGATIARELHSTQGEAVPWWLTLALDWFPAVLVALLMAWWLDLPLGATVLVFLIVVGITKVAQRLVRAARGSRDGAAGGGGPQGGGKAG